MENEANKHTALDIQLRKLHEQAQRTLNVRNGECIVLAKKENDKTTTACYGNEADVSECICSLFQSNENLCRSFISQLSQEGQFYGIILKEAVLANPGKVLELMQSHFLTVALPLEMSDKEMANSLRQLAEKLDNITDNAASK